MPPKIIVIGSTALAIAVSLGWWRYSVTLSTNVEPIPAAPPTTLPPSAHHQLTYEIAESTTDHPALDAT